MNDEVAEMADELDGLQRNYLNNAIKAMELQAETFAMIKQWLESQLPKARDESPAPNADMAIGGYTIPPGKYTVAQPMTVKDFVACVGVGIYLEPIPSDERREPSDERQPEISDEEFENSMECLEAICTRYLQGETTRSSTARLLQEYIKTVGKRIGIIPPSDE